MRTCIDCGVSMMTDHAWYKLPLTQRHQLRADGITYHAAHGLCPTCYLREWRAARRTTRRVVDVAADWADLVDHRYSQKENVRHLAPRLGMTEGALERAVLRAKRRGLLEVAA